MVDIVNNGLIGLGFMHTPLEKLANGSTETKAGFGRRPMPHSSSHYLNCFTCSTSCVSINNLNFCSPLLYMHITLFYSHLFSFRNPL